MFGPDDLHDAPIHSAVFLAHPRKRCKQHQWHSALAVPHFVLVLGPKAGRSVGLLEVVD
jgi:hypothetical protein